jgi:hypothetical protein
MRKLMLLIALIYCSVAFAQSSPHHIRYIGLTNVPANAAAAARTLTLNTREVTQLSLVVNLTRVAATDVSITMRVQLLGSTLWGAQHALSIAAGTVTLSPATYVRAVAGDAEILIEMPVSRYGAVEFVFVATGGGATDLISVAAVGTKEL